MFVFDHQQKEQCQIAIKVNDKSPATRQISFGFWNLSQNESYVYISIIYIEV